MTAVSIVPPLDEQRRSAAVEMLRARADAYAANLGEVFDLLTLEIFIARLQLAAATDPAEQDTWLGEVHALSQKRCHLLDRFTRTD